MFHFTHSYKRCTVTEGYVISGPLSGKTVSMINIATWLRVADNIMCADLIVFVVTGCCAFSLRAPHMAIGEGDKQSSVHSSRAVG